MKHVNCLLCGANDARILDEHLRDPYLPPDVPCRTVICRRCGFVYTNPQPEEAELRAIYSTTYANTRLGTPPRDYLLRKNYDAERKVGWILRHLDAVPGRVLDIGCGAGNLLLAFRRRGSEVVGIEPTPHFAEFARREYGLDVRVGFLDPSLFSPAAFDLIVLAETLEHLPNPREALKAIRAWLRPAGALYLDVPNVLRPNKLRLPVKFFRAEHMSYFSPNTLRLLLQSEGFEVIAHTAGFYQYAIAGKTPPMPVDYAAAGDDYRATMRAIRWRALYLASQAWRKPVKQLFTLVLGPARGLRVIERLARSSGALAVR